MGGVPRCTGMILVGSDGRRSGKTELACSILRYFSPSYAVTAAKITTVHTGVHCPKGKNGCGACGEVGDSYRILKEHSVDGRKDTARLHAAGAGEVLWVQSRYDALGDALEALLSMIPANRLWLCESNSIRRFAEPDVFLLVRRADRHALKPSADAVLKYADRIVMSTGRSFDFDPRMLAIENGMWVLRHG